MSESLHQSDAPPEVALYRENIAAFAGARTAPAIPGPAEPILDFSLRAAILDLDQRLQAATEEYAAASGLLAEATIDLHERRMQLTYAEDMETLRLIQAIPGKNAEERKAHLAVGLWEADEVDEARTARDEVVARQARAEHHYRTLDVAQKSLRARLDALSALVRAA
jgi:hypothetical protein